MEPKLYDGFLETVAETRFSDFTGNGLLHYSKSLMYFEKARFTVAHVSGIREVLERVMPDTRIAFVVIRARLTMQRPIQLKPNLDAPEILVRTWLEPAFCQLNFRQQLIDPEGNVLTEGLINVVILADEKVLRHFPNEVRDCLERYEKLVSVGITEE